MEKPTMKGKFTRQRATRRYYIGFTLVLMRDGVHFGKQENNFNLSVIKKYVRYEEFNLKYC